MTKTPLRYNTIPIVLELDPLFLIRWKVARHLDRPSNIAWRRQVVFDVYFRNDGALLEQPSVVLDEEFLKSISHSIRQKVTKKNQELLPIFFFTKQLEVCVKSCSFLFLNSIKGKIIRQLFVKPCFYYSYVAESQSTVVLPGD